MNTVKRIVKFVPSVSTENFRATNGKHGEWPGGIFHCGDPAPDVKAASAKSAVHEASPSWQAFTTTYSVVCRFVMHTAYVAKVSAPPPAGNGSAVPSAEISNCLVIVDVSSSAPAKPAKAMKKRETATKSFFIGSPSRNGFYNPVVWTR